MNIPTLAGTIRRRLLINYRISPDAVARILPPVFRPKLVGGHAIAGICLIRLEEVRPKGFPRAMGISSENSAHRFAVEWDDPSGGSREGVYVPRRDTDSLLNALAGGRLFPGVHRHSKFVITDEGGQISIRIESDDHDEPLIEIEAEETAIFPSASVFGSLEESSRFFENGCTGYSSRPDSEIMDGLSLTIPEWKVAPLNVKKLRSAYFDNPDVFLPRDIEFDHALLMRDVVHEWHSQPQMRAGSARERTSG